MYGHPWQPWVHPAGPIVAGAINLGPPGPATYHDPRIRWGRASSCERWTSRASLPAPPPNSFGHLNLCAGPPRMQSMPASVVAPPALAKPAFLSLHSRDPRQRPECPEVRRRASESSLRPGIPGPFASELRPRSEVTAALDLLSACSLRPSSVPPAPARSASTVVKCEMLGTEASSEPVHPGRQEQPMAMASPQSLKSAASSSPRRSPCPVMPFVGSFVLRNAATEASALPRTHDPVTLTARSISCHCKAFMRQQMARSVGDEDFATGWVEANVADTHDGFGLSLGDVASGGFTVEGSQPEARNPRRVSFSDDPPESRTFNKTDLDTGAGVGAWPEETSPAKPDAAQNLHPEELCWNCGKRFDHWDSVFCRHCGAKRGSPAVPNTPSHSEPATLSTLERRFSFSLMDMADGQGGLRTGWHTGLQTGLAGSPYLPGSEPIRESLEMQKWNPLDGVRRHWQPRDEEFRHPGHVQSDGAGPYLLAATQSGSIVEEVQKAEHRLEGLQQKISNLESSLSRDKWPSGGRVAVSLADTHDGDLGIALHGLTISGITNTQVANMAGWAVGDHILQVNGVIVLNPQQLAQELRKEEILRKSFALRPQASWTNHHGQPALRDRARKVRVSAIQRKVAYLALKARWKWNEVEKICQRLTEEWKQPPLLCLLLPTAASDEALTALDALSDRGVLIEAFAETLYCGQEVCLWILRWEGENPTNDPPAITLELFASLVTAATAKLHPPDSGPFLWPLHDKDIASAIALCEYAGNDAPWWRKVLWALRIIQPPGGTVLEECLLDHYGREVGYVFAWTNVFVRSLWVLTAVCLAFWICGARPQMGGYEGTLWYLLQFLILCWAICLCAVAGSRRSVLRSGGIHGNAASNFRVVGCSPESSNMPSNMQTNMPTNMPSTANSGSAPSVDGTGWSEQGDSQHGHVADELPMGQFQSLRARTSPLEETGVGLDSSLHLRKVSKSMHDLGPPLTSKDVHSPARLLEGIDEVPQEKRREMGEKLQRALLKAKFIGWESKQIAVRRHNPDYTARRWPRAWAVFAGFVTVVVMLAFLAAAFILLTFFLNMKSHLIYDWGDCLRESCNNPLHKHGIKGLLADIAVDISLALIFVVLLGEACKAVAAALAKLWNFKYMRRRQYVQAMLSLFIEILAKVGVFSLLAFIFLPSWHPDPVSTELPDARQACKDFPDYQICSNMAGCDLRDDPLCCSGTLLCAKSFLSFENRRLLFEQWLLGPFIVCPFVDMIPAVLAPLIAKRLNNWADHRDTNAKANQSGMCTRIRRCLARWWCLCCGVPLARLLSLIFVLDAEVTGLRYLCCGRTFATTELDMSDADNDDCCERCLDGPLEQVVLREFDALDELKDIKLNFLFVVLFAPVLPWGIIPTLLARLLEVRCKLPKLFLVRRRSFPRDAQLLHSTQESFTDVVTSFAVFWYLGLSMVTYNTELYGWSATELLLIWSGLGLIGSILVSLSVRFLQKYVEKRASATGN
ncbi:unnamed protein product [Symbiodinium sp. KB8]|nr:unnamed protein product [Symbiodinium sp. KB8]